MSHHSIAEAKTHLSDLIDRALAGDGIVITRHGRPVVELRPVSPPPRNVTDLDLDWLDEHRVGEPRAPTDAGQLLSTMRDDDER
jgi:prevent-host-death family protein